MNRNRSTVVISSSMASAPTASGVAILQESRAVVLVRSGSGVDSKMMMILPSIVVKAFA
jgi:hypothetical protein